MEPLLTEWWLLVSLVAVSTCYARGPGGACASCNRCRRDVAVLCILALLLPAIAAADDWYIECFDQSGAGEAWMVPKHSATSNSDNAPAREAGRLVLALVALATEQGQPHQVLGLATTQERQKVPPSQVERRYGRAPPSSWLTNPQIGTAT